MTRIEASGRWRYTVLSLAVAFMLCLMPVSVDGKVLLHQSFEADPVGKFTRQGGHFTQGSALRGWSATLSEDDMDIREYLSMGLSENSPFNANGGTITLSIERNNVDISHPGKFHNALFQILDATKNPIMVASIVWDPVFFPGKNILEISDASIWGNRFIFDEIQPGEPVKLSFTWDLDASNNQVFINGEALDGYVIKGFKNGEFNLTSDYQKSGFSNILNKASELVLGMEFHDSNPLGGYSPLSRFILGDLTISDSYMQGRPAIESIAHDAFEVAGYSGKLVHGDTYTVTLVAEQRGMATFDLGPVKGHLMTEDPENPGTYKGIHQVGYGEDIEEGKVVGHFRDEHGIVAIQAKALRTITVDSKVYIQIQSSNDLVPADESSRSGLTIVATDANGKAIKGRELKLTLSTTDEYTGNVGGITFEDLVGGELDVDWGGVTDSFGEVTAQYVSGFAAKTILVSAKEMVTGDVGIGWVRSYIDGIVDIVVTEPQARSLAVAGSMDVSLSRDWLTADGKSRSRITAVVKDASGDAVSGHSVQFTLLGDNGELRVVQGKTDSRGRANADYIAGTLMGQVQVEVRDLTSGLTAIVSIELHPDAPAEIILKADPGQVVTGDLSSVTAKVTDANGNPNASVDVLYNIASGSGSVGVPSVPTDEAGVASVQFTAGETAGLVTVRGTVISREPTAEEISAAQGAVFLYGLDKEPGRLDVVEWLVKVGDEVVEGQELVVLEDRRDNVYTILAPRDGIVSTFMAEERDRVEYGDTLGYVIEIPE